VAKAHREHDWYADLPAPRTGGDAAALDVNRYHNGPTSVLLCGPHARQRRAAGHDVTVVGDGAAGVVCADCEAEKQKPRQLEMRLCPT